MISLARPFLLLALFAFIQSSGQTAEPATELPPTKAHLQIQRDGLPNFFAKAKKEGKVNVAYLGGSITAAQGWRIFTREWLGKQFPQTEFIEINAAIGGTGSDLGVYRLGHDVLQYQPDLMFVEFAVNDGGADPRQIWKAMEGIVRQTWARFPNCDICFVYTFRVGYEKELSQGLLPRAASANEKLAEHYRIPSINMALRTVQIADEGKLIYKAEPDSAEAEAAKAKGQIVFSKDGVHPVEAGHRIYTEVISKALEDWNQDKITAIDHSKKLATSFVPGHWQAAQMVVIDPAMLQGDWKKLPAENSLMKKFSKRLGQLWQADTPGQSLNFRFRGSAVKLYDLLGPDGGQVIITIDGVRQDKLIPRFDSYCTYHRIATLKITSGLDPKKFHTIKVEVHPEQPDRKAVSHRLKNPEKELQGEKYQGTRLRVGGIQFLGDKIEAL
ncbi:MAG: SGNH/GDSL hydrolase family protein [Verrucomicrobiota bacterium]